MEFCVCLGFVVRIGVFGMGKQGLPRFLEKWNWACEIRSIKLGFLVVMCLKFQSPSELYASHVSGPVPVLGRNCINKSTIVGDSILQSRFDDP